MIRAVILSTLLLSPLQASAAETLVVAAKQIHGLIDSPSSGDFVKMLRAIEKFSDLRFQVMVLPPARAVHVFETGGADILFPHPYKSSEFAQSFYTKRSFLFHQCRKPLTRYEDLQGKSVALTRGYEYNHEAVLAHAREIVIVSSDDIALRMLNQQRVDAVIGEEVSLTNVIRDQGLGGVCCDKHAVLESTGVFMRFAHKQPLQKAEKLINSLLQKAAVALDQVSPVR